jgi:hypothetical protein
MKVKSLSWNQLGIGVSFFLSSLFVPALGQADPYFPDINSKDGIISEGGKAFRTALERALDTQKSTFSVENDGKTYRYLVSYGENYTITHTFYMLPTPKDEATDTDGTEALEHSLTASPSNFQIKDTFKEKLLKNAIYRIEETEFDTTLQYSVFLKAPKIPVNPNHPNEKVAHTVGGLFSPSADTVYKIPSQDEGLQGPYFTFTVTALDELEPIDEKYLNKDGSIQRLYVAIVERLIIDCMQATLADSKKIQEAKTRMLINLQERSKLNTRVSELASSAYSNPNDETILESIAHTQLQIREIDHKNELERSIIEELYVPEVVDHMTYPHIASYILEHSKLSENVVTLALNTIGPLTISQARHKLKVFN